MLRMVPLPRYRGGGSFLFVVAGLDPAIHADAALGARVSGSV